MASDPFDSARAEFVTKEDMHGRLLLIEPLVLESLQSTAQGAKEGDMYESVTCNVTVLDGEVNDKIDVVPLVLESIPMSGKGLAAQLKGKLPDRNPRFKYVLGRLGQVRAPKYGSTARAWVLQEPSDKDKTIARAYLESLDPFA